MVGRKCDRHERGRLEHYGGLSEREGYRPTKQKEENEPSRPHQ